VANPTQMEALKSRGERSHFRPALFAASGEESLVGDHDGSPIEFFQPSSLGAPACIEKSPREQG